MGYMLIRSGRRTLALEINSRGELVVRAPQNMPIGDIEDFIKQKQGWIREKQSAARARSEQARALEWCNGAVLPYLDGYIAVKACDARAPKLEGGTLCLPQKKDLRAEGRRWLKARAEELLPQRVAHWARVMKLAPKRLVWSSAKCRWGSMKSDGTLRLNLALMHCPWEAIDYVIVHELAHMRVSNHSPEFHALVRAYLPDADARREAMKRMGAYTAI